MVKADSFPAVSVIINTDDRVKSLSTCLESLRYLRYPNFEVVVVAGPTRDGTHELCRNYSNQIKFAECPHRNLSMSRNISIQISSGELVAFLDDDSIPEPEWLEDVVPAFKDPDVAVAGGFLHDHTGKTYQWTFGTLNRYGTADTSWKRATPAFNFPNSFNYPHVMANSLFRRTAVVGVGGFDEEYEYFLDESDIILRLVDMGWKVAQLDKGFIHHKFMSSHIRNESRILTSWYSVIKNKTYFSLQNARDHTSIDGVLSVIQSAIQEFRNHVKWAVNERMVDPSSLVKFEDDVDRALRDGLTRGLDGKRKLVATESLKGQPGFRRFLPLLKASEQHCYVFLTRTYPPGSIGGIGRYIHQLAQGIARIGHQVHVLTAGQDHDRVDFENGVWVHRICIKELTPPDDIIIPQHIWNYSNTMHIEADAIASRREIDCVYAPIWDVEGIAFLVRHKYKLITSLQTTLQFYLDTNPDKANDPIFVETFAKPMLALERRMMLESDGIHAISKAIVDAIENSYRFHFHPETLDIVPLGLDDWTLLEVGSPIRTSDDTIRICFIGRLESRKGIDIFLEVVPEILKKYQHVHVDIVGNDEIKNSNGISYRSLFEAENASFRGHPDLVFHGEVSEEQLRKFYRSADIIVAPSRFESFGLVHLEAMIYGKPVIGCNIGGMKEVVEDGITGLLAVPGDANSFRICLETLLNDENLRMELGANARQAYLERFHTQSMAEGVIHCLEKVVNRR
jgi:glycogen synthase